MLFCGASTILPSTFLTMHPTAGFFLLLPAQASWSPLKCNPLLDLDAAAGQLCKNVQCPERPPLLGTGTLSLPDATPWPAGT